MNDAQDAAGDFTLHARLAADCAVIGDLPLCRLLLSNDRRFPWCILVPRLPGLREFHDLPRRHRVALLDEIERVSECLLQETGVCKLNVAALGNLVPQLHIHVVARRATDAAWPGPVWGSGTAEPHTAGELREQVARLHRALDIRSPD